MDRSSASLIFLTLVVGNSQTFEVASVKPSTQTTGRITMKGGPGTSDPTRIAYTNIMLKRLLIGAYDVRSDQIVGPDWLDIQRFDIAATLPEGATREQFQAMLRNLLETRFRMTIHRETKELPIYALIPLKKGTKLRADSDSPVTPTEEHLAVIQSKDGRDGFPALKMTSPGLVIETRNGRARITAREVSLKKFADLLSGQLARPVIDTTNLPGDYTFTLYFTPEGPNSAESSDPSIFGALEEQLGLRLESRKGPVELLVIDQAAKVPTGN